MAKTLTSTPSRLIETERLQVGLVDLSRWSNQLLVPFQVRRLKKPRVIWINDRWLLERGYDTRSNSDVILLSNWLIEEFGWVVECSGTGSDVKQVFADRYGTTDAAIQHGGSGRVATLGCFQLKGVGQTPLVSDGLPEGHSHGCLSVAEALREAIFSEIAHAEFPHRAVPVIAILDTGLSFSSPSLDDLFDQNARRALLVRPSVIRPAHAERAALFKCSVTGFKNVQQHDVTRTKDVVIHWSALGQALDSGYDFVALRKLVTAVAEQVAFGQVYRFFSGGYFSSNLSINGELLDFGNAHALPNWVSTQVHSSAVGFGRELELFNRVIASLSFFFVKYSQRGDALGLTQELQALADATYIASWKRYSLELFGCAKVDECFGDSIFGLLRQYFIKQQKVFVKYRFGEIVGSADHRAFNWIYGQFVEPSCAQFGEEKVFGDALAHCLSTLAASFQYVSLWTASRLLKPRDSIERKRLLFALDRLVPKPNDCCEVERATIQEFVDITISDARRRWPNLPSEYAVHAHVTHIGSSALICSTGQSRSSRFVWLEGTLSGTNTFHFMGRQLVKEKLGSIKVDATSKSWSVVCRLNVNANGDHFALTDHEEIPLPRMTVHYDRPFALNS